MNILAPDLGKFKSVSCLLDMHTNATQFWTLRSVRQYLATMRHCLAISNHRLLSADYAQVVFRYPDRRDGHGQKSISLPIDEFLVRILLHVWPDGFMRIRHYGFLASGVKKESLARCRQQFELEASPREPKTAVQWMLALTGRDIPRGPQCGGPLRRWELPPTLDRLPVRQDRPKTRRALVARRPPRMPKDCR